MPLVLPLYTNLIKFHQFSLCIILICEKQNAACFKKGQSFQGLRQTSLSMELFIIISDLKVGQFNSRN